MNEKCPYCGRCDTRQVHASPEWRKCNDCDRYYQPEACATASLPVRDLGAVGISPLLPHPSERQVVLSGIKTMPDDTQKLLDRVSIEALKVLVASELYVHAGDADSVAFQAHVLAEAWLNERERLRRMP